MEQDPIDSPANGEQGIPDRTDFSSNRGDVDRSAGEVGTDRPGVEGGQDLDHDQPARFTSAPFPGSTNFENLRSETFEEDIPAEECGRLNAFFLVDRGDQR